MVRRGHSIPPHPKKPKLRPLTEFQLFDRLPPEIKMEIWKIHIQSACCFLLRCLQGSEPKKIRCFKTKGGLAMLFPYSNPDEIFHKPYLLPKAASRFFPQKQTLDDDCLYYSSSAGKQIWPEAVVKAKIFTSLHIDHLSRKIALSEFDALGEA